MKTLILNNAKILNNEEFSCWRWTIDDTTIVKLIHFYKSSDFVLKLNDLTIAILDNCETENKAAFWKEIECVLEKHQIRCVARNPLCVMDSWVI